jgi:hypothetical protein
MVLRLLRAGVSESSILFVISAAAGTFDTSADALAALKQAGASEAELSAIAPQGAPPANAAPANAPPAGAQTNSGPSLAETMKYIQDKVNQQGKIEYAFSESNPATGFSFPQFQRSEESQVIAVDPAGGLSVQKSYAADNEIETEIETWRLNFKDVGKLEVLSATDSYSRNNPGWEHQISPQYFYLDIHLIAGKTVQKHVSEVFNEKSGKHGKPTSSDSSTRELHLSFSDEESADRAAKAFVHAVELCGGGSKPELF